MRAPSNCLLCTLNSGRATVCSCADGGAWCCKELQCLPTLCCWNNLFTCIEGNSAKKNTDYVWVWSAIALPHLVLLCCTCFKIQLSVQALYCSLLCAAWYTPHQYVCICISCLYISLFLLLPKYLVWLVTVQSSVKFSKSWYHEPASNNVGLAAYANEGLL